MGKFIELGERNVKFGKYVILKTLREKNEWFRSVFLINSITSFSENDIFELLDICFWIFKENFEANSHSEYWYVADVCEKLIMRYLEIVPWENVVNDEKKLERIIDTVSFVYDLSYRYNEEAVILKRIADDDKVQIKLRKRALQRLTSIEPEFIAFLGAERNKYIQMLNNMDDGEAH